MYLVDNHAHLQFSEFNSFKDQALANARKAGVKNIVVSGISSDDWRDIKHLANEHFDIIPSFGVHPWEVEKQPADWFRLLQKYLKKIPSGVGEIGLDRWIKPRNETLQKEFFIKQMNLAAKLNLPVSIHILKAWDWYFEVIKEINPMPKRMMFHVFNGSIQVLEKLLATEAMFSIGGNILDKKRKQAREVFQAIPEDRLLLETDSPSMLPPEEYRISSPTVVNGKIINEPANLDKIASGLAEIKGVDKISLIKTTYENSKNFWGDIFNE